MGTTSEKLVLLALGSENIDEAVAALRRARKHQPSGKLQISLDREWARLATEREAFQAERDAFDAEQRDYQRRIVLGDTERAKTRPWADLSAYALVLGKSAAALVLSFAIVGGAGYGTAAMGGVSGTRQALAERICDAMGQTALLDCADQ